MHGRERERVYAGMAGRERESTHVWGEREEALQLLFLCVFSFPLGLAYANWAQAGALLYLKSSLRSSDLPLTFLCSIFAGFSLPCLLVPAILDSCFLFQQPNRKKRERKGRKKGGKFPNIQRLGLSAFTDMRPSPNPGWRTKILEAMWHGKKKLKNKERKESNSKTERKSKEGRDREREDVGVKGGREIRNIKNQCFSVMSFRPNWSWFSQTYFAWEVLDWGQSLRSWPEILRQK